MDKMDAPIIGRTVYYSAEVNKRTIHDGHKLYRDITISPYKHARNGIFLGTSTIYVGELISTHEDEDGLVESYLRIDRSIKVYVIQPFGFNNRYMYPVKCLPEHVYLTTEEIK